MKWAELEAGRQDPDVGRQSSAPASADAKQIGKIGGAERPRRGAAAEKRRAPACFQTSSSSIPSFADKGSRDPRIGFRVLPCVIFRRRSGDPVLELQVPTGRESLVRVDRRARIPEQHRVPVRIE
jgi:hypothetical protein